MNKPFVLIPAHNRREFTLGCLAVLRANGDLDECGVIVVDDGSNDGTGGAVRTMFPDVILLTGNGDLFWTGAIALAMREAAAREAGPLIWLNDDCRPRPGALRTLRNFLERNPGALAGPQCVDAATGAAVATGFIGRRTFTVAPGETQAVQGLSGFCVGVGAVAAARLGLPDAENFPHYAGDTAYSLRASRAGCPVTLVGDAVVDLVNHGGGPASLEARVRLDASYRENWGRIFSAMNSPYRLHTMWALQRLKYGAMAGSVLAGARTVAWMMRLGWAKARR